MSDPRFQAPCRKLPPGRAVGLGGSVARSASRGRRRRGSIYIIVLSLAVLISVISLGGLMLSRIDRQIATMEQDYDAAGMQAFSAIEYALAKLSDDFWWRDVYRNNKDGNYTPEIPFGRGTISFQLLDPVDNHIEDDSADPVRIFGRGKVGDSVRVYSVLAFPQGDVLDVLRTAVHSSGRLEVKTGSLDVRNGPASTNSDLRVGGTLLLGDAEANTVDVPANVTGTVTTPAPAKLMPSVVLHDAFKTFASEIKLTELPWITGWKYAIQSVVVSPASNPTASKPKNPLGIYWIKVGKGYELVIQNCRIEGTLLIQLDGDATFGGKLTMGDNVVWKPYSPDFPALIVYTKGDNGTDVQIKCAGLLDEAALAVNFNPSHTPYYGDSDVDLWDTYQASIEGVIHIIRDRALPPTVSTDIIAPRKIKGCIIVNGDIQTDANCIVVANPTFLSAPPLGYTTTADPTNLLTNGDMEAGLAGWSAVGSGTTLAWSGTNHSAAKGIEVANRATAAGGIKQDVTGQIANGVTFNTEVWLKMNDNPEDARISLEVDSSGEGTQWFTVNVAVPKTAYTRFQAPFTPTWTGTLNYARWVVTTTTSTQKFYIDDAMIRDPNEQLPPNLKAVPGTWQFESQ